MDRSLSIEFKQWNLGYMNLSSVATMTLGILCIILGIISQTYQNDYSRHIIRYDNVCNVIGQNCSVTVQVSKTMKAPVFVSFELSGFFQNTDAYFQSRSQEQFYGNPNFDPNDCHPYITNKNMSKTISITGQALNEDDVAIPCGVVAYTYVNDSYIIDGLNISSEGIAWAYDVARFKNINETKQWIDMTDQRFINWVRVSGLSVMRKLWGVINEDVPPGTYSVTIQNNFDVQQYNGFKKYFLLHNDRTYDDPVLVVTLPCLCAGSFFFVIGLVGFLKFKSMPLLQKKYRLI